MKLENNKLVFNYENNLNFRNITLLKNALVYVNSIDGQENTINIQGGNVKVLNGSLVFIQNQGFKQNGEISINSGILEVKGASEFGLSGIFSSNYGNTPGERIEINVNQLDIEGAQIATTTFSNAAGGDITINANNYLRVAGSDPSAINPFGYGGINTFSYINYGNGGNITGTTQNLILENSANITTASSSFAGAGNVKITAENITLKNGSSLGSTTFNTGKGGDVTVNASNSINIIGRSPLVGTSTINAATFGSGNAGNLEINTSKLGIRDGAGVSTSTVSFGSAGNLTINASDSVNISGVDSNSKLPSFIDSSAAVLDNSLRGRFNRVPATPTGDAGRITINTKQFNIKDIAQISVRNDGSGNAGGLEIKAEDINIINNGGITATTAVGEGGDIILNANNVLLGNGNISATAGQQGTKGDGGNIIINTDILVALNSSAIAANAFEGRGGNIQINAKGFFVSPDSKLTASSERGVQGTVEINVQDRNPSQTKVQPEAIAQTPEVASVCQGRSGKVASTFVNVGTGGLPVEFDNELDSNSIWQRNSVSLESIDNSKQASSLVEEPTQIVEAQGWMLNSDGDVVLTAQANPGIPYTSVPNRACHAQTPAKKYSQQ